MFDLYIGSLTEEGILERVDEFLCTPGYQVRKDTLYDRVSAALMGAMEKAGFDFVRYSEIPVGSVDPDVEDDIRNILLEEGKIVKVTDEMYTLSSYMEEAKEKIQEKLKEDLYCNRCICPGNQAAQNREDGQLAKKQAEKVRVAYR